MKFSLKTIFLVIPSLLNSCEVWTLKAKRCKKTKGSRDEVHEPHRGYSLLDCTRNKCDLELKSRQSKGN